MTIDFEADEVRISGITTARNPQKVDVAAEGVDMDELAKSLSQEFLAQALTADGAIGACGKGWLLEIIGAKAAADHFGLLLPGGDEWEGL